jgi:hypothetical protein
MSLILGFVFSSYTELPIVFSGMEYLVAFFVKLVGSPFVCFRHTGKAICICPWFSLVWNIIEGIAKGILSFKIFPDNKTADYITQFFPLESMSNLIVEPFLDCLL